MNLKDAAVCKKVIYFRKDITKAYAREYLVYQFLKFEFFTVSLR